MPELPKIVISKLMISQQTEGALPPGTPHPDPDLLTAFVERTAPDRERTAVLTHLADCAPCREIVALAQAPATATTTLYMPKPTRSLFFLRWGALAACAVLAVSAVFVYQRKPAELSSLAKNQIAQPQFATPVPPSSATPAKGSATTSEADQAQAAKSALAQAEPARVWQTEVANGSASDSTRKMPAKMKQSSPSNRNESSLEDRARAGDSATKTPSELPLQGRNLIALSPFIPGVSRSAPAAMGARADSTQPQTPVTSVAVPSKEAPLNAEQKAREEVANSAVAKKAQQTDALKKRAAAETVEVTGQAVAAETSTATPYAPTSKDDFRASSAPIANLDLATARQAATWQITPDGHLQSSHDGGKSWNQIPLDPKARLRVVAATGFDVWAAGNDAILVHSHDSGTHFATVKVRQNHQTLKGDIVTLTFPDAQSGRLETADHQVWTTTDAGKTWHPTAGSK